MKRRWRLFTYSLWDRAAAQDMLNRMGEQGWAVKGVYLDSVVSFRPADDPEAYCIDWCDPMRDEEEEYLRLCADAGWQLVQKTKYFAIYRGRPGTTPIQTDPAEEYRRFQRQVVRREKNWIAVAGVLALLWVLLLAVAMRSDVQIQKEAFWPELLSGSILSPVLVFLLPVLLVGGICQGLSAFWHLREWKIAVGNGTFPAMGSLGRVRLRLGLNLLLYGAVWLTYLALFLQWAQLSSIQIMLLLAIAAAICLVRGSKDGPRRSFYGLCGRRYLIVLGFVMVTALFLPEGQRFLIPPLPPEEVCSLLEKPSGEKFRFGETTQGSLWLSRTSWFEFREDEPEERGIQTEASLWSSRSRWGSEAVWKRYWEETFQPLEGRENVWGQQETVSGGGVVWYLLARQGGRIFWVELYVEQGDDLPWRERCLDRMEVILDS